MSKDQIHKSLEKSVRKDPVEPTYVRKQEWKSVPKIPFQELFLEVQEVDH